VGDDYFSSVLKILHCAPYAPLIMSSNNGYNGRNVPYARVMNSNEIHYAAAAATSVKKCVTCKHMCEYWAFRDRAQNPKNGRCLSTPTFCHTCDTGPFCAGCSTCHEGHDLSQPDIDKPRQTFYCQCTGQPIVTLSRL
jgi:hypothetical protein